MQTVGLTWQHAGETAAVLAALGGSPALTRHPRARAVAALLRETATVGVLYGLWQLAGQVSVTGTQGAFARAHWIQRFDAHLPLPSEAAVQHTVLDHPLLVQGANLYYASMHLSVMLGFLLWLFVRHRDRYRPVRQVLAWATLGCLVIELLPVAPPRMLPGFIDTAAQYDQSVYTNGLPIDQLSAMPSMHVAWAVLVGWYGWRVTTSRWRWLAPVHATLVVFAVVATANHWWLDGIVATAVLVVAAWGVAGVRTAWVAVRVPRPLAVAALAPAID